MATGTSSRVSSVDELLERTLKHKDAISKYVKIKTVDKREYEGWVKCIDPRSGSLFLITFDEEFTNVLDVVLIMGDGYTSLEVIKDSDDKIKEILKELYSGDMPHEIHKKKVIAWIEKHRLPVDEYDDGTLRVSKTVTVHPPYAPENCSSKNVNVLKNVCRMMAKMPLSDEDESEG